METETEALTDKEREQLARLMYNQLRALHGMAPKPDERAANHLARKFAGDVPKCFDRESYRLWHKAARDASPGALGPCTDCTPARKMLMKEQGRCERPEIKFRYDDDGFIEGFWPSVRKRKHRKTEDA